MLCVNKASSESKRTFKDKKQDNQIPKRTHEKHAKGEDLPFISMFNEYLNGRAWTDVSIQVCLKCNVKKMTILLTLQHQISNKVFLFYINHHQPYIKLNSWFTEKRVPSVKSLGELT